MLITQGMTFRGLPVKVATRENNSMTLSVPIFVGVGEPCAVRRCWTVAAESVVA